MLAVNLEAKAFKYLDKSTPDSCLNLGIFRL